MKREDFSEEVIKYIVGKTNRELGELTVEKITGALNISRSHLYEVFRKEKKFTPGGFLLLVKMVRSVTLLVENKRLSVEKIAEILGFSSPEYFNRIFKDHFGTTPSRYRRYAKSK